MTITKKIVADKISSYLYHKITLEKLVEWAESVMMEDEFDSRDMKAIRDVVSRLGLADVRSFGLTWDDCEKFLKKLGYSARIKIGVA
jgi:hypothetical protein